MHLKIIDNFLDEETFQKISDHVKDNRFDWHRSRILFSDNFKGNKLYNLQFTHVFYDPYKRIQANDSPIVYPVLKKINEEIIQIDSLAKVKANLHVNRGEQYYTGYHVDEKKENLGKGNSAVFYINTNNGGTHFKTDEEEQLVDSVKNRIVIFPNNISHSTYTANDVPFRIVINFNWKGSLI